MKFEIKILINHFNKNEMEIAFRKSLTRDCPLWRRHLNGWYGKFWFEAGIRVGIRIRAFMEGEQWMILDLRGKKS